MTDVNATIISSTVDSLRNISAAIDKFDIGVSFPEPDGAFADECPFVDEAIEAIEHGGQIEAACLSSLVQYIADMMEK